jgi:LmbE family N-acetylglucosaminyl deacetylase
MSEFRPRSLGTILGVWAHPDDEAYLSAGIMAMCRQTGARVVCVTATKGEAGSPDPARWPNDAMAAVRTAELEASLQVLGVVEHHWLDCRDGECSTQDPEVPVRRLVRLLEEVAPNTVLGFGPEGFTNHPDHQAVSAWTTEAFRRWGDEHAKLHYAVQTTDWVNRYAVEFTRIGVFAPGTPPAFPPDELSIDVSLTPELNELKWKALCAQASQTEGFIALIGEQVYRDAFVQTERFRRVEFDGERPCRGHGPAR